MNHLVNEIEKALDVTGRIVEGIREDQWGEPTVCEGWDVRTVTNHVVGGLRLYTAELTGVATGKAHEDDWLGSDARAAYRSAARDVVSAWRAPGVLNRTLQISLGPVPAPLGALIEFTEIVVHGADLAVATGQEDRVDSDQAERLLALMRSHGVDNFRVDGVFGPEVSVPHDAPAHRRLMAFLGRSLRGAPEPVVAGTRTSV